VRCVTDFRLFVRYYSKYLVHAKASIAMSISSRFIAIFLTALLAVAGCGQKGPLYLPGDTSAIRTTVPLQQAPAEDEEDEESEAPPTLRD
jgi:predicted small lipoprotein YifL